MITFEELSDIRAGRPEAIREALQSRKRRDLVGNDGRLFIIAADHPARGVLGVGADPQAMSSRRELLDRLALALSKPGVDGVLGTPDIIDDLALMGLLDNKIVVGSMNRGGLLGSKFEYDDRYTAYTISRIVQDGLDCAKSLVRINRKDPATVRTLEHCAKAVHMAADAKIPFMLEPFMSTWVDGEAHNDLSADAVVLSISIAQGLGASSAYTWLKLPVVDGIERVMEATTLPTLLLGGETHGRLDSAFASWQSALTIPGVRGLVVGRSLLYPTDGNVEQAVDLAAAMVHPHH